MTQHGKETPCKPGKKHGESPHGKDSGLESSCTEQISCGCLEGLDAAMQPGPGGVAGTESKVGVAQYL